MVTRRVSEGLATFMVAQRGPRLRVGLPEALNQQAVSHGSNTLSETRCWRTALQARRSVNRHFLAWSRVCVFELRSFMRFSRC